MTLANLLEEIDRLSEEELRQIQEHIDRRRRETAQARADALMEAIDKLREGLTEEQIEEMEQAMNAEPACAAAAAGHPYAARS